MGLVKVLLKAVLIPIIAFVVIVGIAIFLFIRHRNRKNEEKSLESYNNYGFQPPPITQWGTGPQPSSPFVPVQKPEAVVYPMQHSATATQYPGDAGRHV